MGGLWNMLFNLSTATKILTCDNAEGKSFSRAKILVLHLILYPCAVKQY